MNTALWGWPAKCLLQQEVIEWQKRSSSRSHSRSIPGATVCTSGSRRILTTRDTADGWKSGDELTAGMGQCVAASIRSSADFACSCDLVAAAVLRTGDIGLISQKLHGIYGLVTCRVFFYSFNFIYLVIIIVTFTVFVVLEARSIVLPSLTIHIQGIPPDMSVHSGHTITILKNCAKQKMYQINFLLL